MFFFVASHFLCKFALLNTKTMFARYIKQEIPDLNGTGETQAYYKMKLTAMSYEEFVNQCAREGHLDKSIIGAVVSLVSEKLALAMAEGYSVKLNGIGTFHAKLGVRDDVVQDAFEEGEPSHNVKTIQVTGVAFRADNDLIYDTYRKCSLKKGGVNRLHKSKLTREERVQKAREYLEKNTFMRVTDYVRLTGLSRTAATDELRKLAHDPTSGITSRGLKSQKFYVLRKA